MTRIRREEPDDIPIVRQLHLAAFGRPDEGRIVDAVRQRSEPTISLVADLLEDDEDGPTGADRAAGRVVGHVLFSPVSIDSPGKAVRAIGLGPMVVHPDFQRSGIGTRLVETGLEMCREAGYEAAVVLGHPTYYPKFGFTLARTRGIHWEHEMPGDPFMAMELRDGALEGVSGIARYLPEFMST